MSFNKYEVGTHNYKIPFDCLKCALNCYENIKEKCKYLMNKNENRLIKNTYGWENEL